MRSDIKDCINCYLSKKITRPCYEIDHFGKDNNLNFLRLSFAYIVLIAHSMALSGFNYPLEKLFNTHIAVCGFFIISGFLILKSYWASKSLKNYIIKRTKRLLPAYSLVIFLSILGGCFFSDLSTLEYFKSPQLLKYFFSNITFLNFLEPSLPGVFENNRLVAVNGALWTLKIEVTFYLIIPIIAKILCACKSKKWINLFLVSLYLFGYFYEFICFFVYDNTGNSLYRILAHQLPGYLQYFAVGIFCFINFDLIKRYNKFFIFPSLILFILYFTDGNDYLLPVALASIIMYFGFNFPRLNNLGRTNDYSYGIYIYHFPIIQVLVSLGYFEVNKNITLLLVLASVFSIAFLSWHFLEKKVLGR